MSSELKQQKSEMYLGYFASVVVALFLSGAVAETIVGQSSGFMADSVAALVQRNLAAGLFMGFALGNPIGVLLTKAPVRPAFDRAGIGFVAGCLLQTFLITPYAGTSLSHFLLLILSVMLVPLALLKDKIDDHYLSLDTTTKEAVSDMVLTVMGWPERFHYIAFMAASFAVFRAYAPSMQATLIALGCILFVATAMVAIAGWHVPYANYDSDDDFQAWLALEPEEPKEQDAYLQARSEVAQLLRNVVPGAVFLGGVTWLAVEIVQQLYPDLGARMDDPALMARTLAEVVVSGLAVVLFGALAAAGFGMMLLQVVARFRRWTAAHLRENCFRLLRNMYMRPIRRGGT